MANKPAPVKNRKTERSTEPCLFFELENTVFGGGRLMYDAVATTLKKCDIEFSPALFARFGLLNPGTRRLNRMFNTLGREKDGADDTAAAIRRCYEQLLAKAKPCPQICKILKDAAARNSRVGALTRGDAAQSAKLLERMAVDFEIPLQPAAQENGRPSPEPWLNLAADLQALPSQCVVLVAEAGGLRSALMAGMHCVVIPDENSAWQDFGGADMVVENTNELNFQQLRALALPVQH